MTDKPKIKDIGNIKCFYGGLYVKAENNIFFWGIEDHGGIEWEEIPESLYNELMKFDMKSS